MSPQVKAVLGTATFADHPEASFGRKEDLPTVFKLFKEAGYHEVDSAAYYHGLVAGSGPHSMERAIAHVVKDEGMVVSTKLLIGIHNTLSEARESLRASLEALNVPKLDILYIHVPDRETPLEEQEREVDALYRQGLLSGSGEVDELVQIAKREHLVPPTVYQGMYNLVARSGEQDLFPVLRKHNMAFYTCSPLGGGFLLGSLRKGGEYDQGSRWDPKRGLEFFTGFFNKDVLFDGLDDLTRLADLHGLTTAQIALRWLRHHSHLSADLGDAVVLGGSKLQHFESNMRDFEGGPLPPHVVEQVERLWERVKQGAPPAYE